MVLILESVITVCSWIVWIAGVIRFLIKEDSSYYMKMITLGIGCITLGHQFQVIRLINNPDNMNFNVGMLGYIGGSMFFYLAIKFEADPMLDNRSRELGKYRIIARILTCAVMLFMIPVVFTGRLSMSIASVFMLLFVVQNAYFLIKQMLIPATAGVSKAIRAYNIPALVYLLSLSANMMFYSGRMPEPVMILVTVFECICELTLIPVYSWGVKKWITS